MTGKRIVLTRIHVTVTVTLTLYGWLMLNGAATRRAICGDPSRTDTYAEPTLVVRR